MGCNNDTDLTSYTYRYSVESINNFKVEFQLNPDSSYQIGRHNYFFDRYKGESQPKYKRGLLTGAEFDTFTELIDGSGLERMDDAYGFDQRGTVENNLVYMIELKQSETSKFVVVNAEANDPIPEKFDRLIVFTSDFINDKLNE
jgi:hypothetical protein